MPKSARTVLFLMANLGIEILKKVIDDAMQENQQFAVRKMEMDNYFQPFTARFMSFYVIE